MQNSAIRLTSPANRLDGSAISNISGNQVRIPLKKESLMAAIQVHFSVSQVGFTVVPTSVDVRRFLQNVAIETSDGRRVFLTGHQAYDLMRLTADYQPFVSSSLGATSTADFTLQVDHWNHNALHGILAAIPAGDLTTFDLVLDMALDTNNGFIGGTTPGVATYTINARSIGYPDMLTDPKTGLRNAIVGSMRHVDERVMQPGSAGAGTSYDLRLISNNLTRFILLHGFDTAAVAGVNTPSDLVINNVRLTIGGNEKSIQTFTELRKANGNKRGLNVVGFACIDFGDDESGWLDLRGVNEPIISVDIATGAPASYLITLAQDYTKLLK